jgi:hypothetical protein
MEKAHGWNYVRSKSNGRKKAPAANGNDRSPPTPLTPFIGTPLSALATPVTPFLASPSVPLMQDFSYTSGFDTPALSSYGLQDDYRRDSLTTNEGSALTYSSGPSPIEPTAFENAVTPEDTTINHNDIFNCGFNGNYATAFQQQPTPALSTGYDNFDTMSFPVNTMPGNLPHLSPTAQPDVTLFSPHGPIDEGFNEPVSSFGGPMGDFTLFESGPSNVNNTADFFPDINQLGVQFGDNFYPDQNLPNAFDGMDMMDFGNPQ